MNVSRTEILKKAKLQYEAKLPFALYNKPNSEKLIAIFQQNNQLHFVKDYQEKGFVFAPFEGKEIVLIPETNSEIMIAAFEKGLNPQNNFLPTTSSDLKARTDFENLIQKGIKAIKNGKFGKVVLSRNEIVELENFEWTTVFQRLINEYPSAFVYCFFHPEVGFWFGAFSEQLLKVKDNVLHTMAVAGTQPFHENEIIWENKEKEEQQFVTDFIVESLATVTSNLTVSKPYSMRAGNIVHIKTDINATLNSDSDLKQVLEILHPTPAVCGLPKNAARDFIFKNEGYDREYYSGFFGELNKDFATSANATDLYVNLRCMQIKEKQAILYIGCGVTKDSDPKKEWIETVNKAQTIKRILTDSN
jgi:isochorismate synthase